MLNPESYSTANPSRDVMAAMSNALIEALKDPSTVVELQLEDWDELLVAARSTSLLARLAVSYQDAGVFEALPPQVRRTLQTAIVYTEHERHQIRWQVQELCRALKDLDTAIVLLKGAAYHLTNMQIAVGRSCRDIDILVPEQRIADVEATLLEGEWEMSLDDQDHVAYFRRWMHELPPLRHRQRGVELDVHRSIVPQTDTIRLNPVDLLEASMPVDADEKLRVLSPEDMLLHSAAHLFRNGDFYFGLRDLSDIDAMLRHFSTSAGFWDRLVARARQLDLRVPCYFALRFTCRVWNTEVPCEISAQFEQWQPMWPVRLLFDWLVPVAILPRHHRASPVNRILAILALSYYPLPRPRAMMTGLFWRKRLPRRARQALPTKVERNSFR